MTRRPSLAAALVVLCAAPSLAQTVPDDNPRVVNITRLLASDDAAVRLAALKSLDALRGGIGWGGWVEPATWRALDSQLLNLLEHDGDAEIACFAGLMMLAGTPDLRASQPYVAERLAAWQRPGTDPAQLADLRAAPANAFDAIWFVVRSALTRLGPATKPPAEQLRAALASHPNAARWRHALALAAIGDVAPLGDCIDSDDAQLRTCAAFALLGAAVPPLAAVRLGLRSDRAVVRLRAIQSMPRLTQVPPELTLQLAAILLDWGQPLHVHAREALVALGPRAASATQMLIPLLDDPSRGGAAVECLGAIGKAAQQAVPSLVANALADRWHEGAQAAGRALANIAPNEAVPRFARAFADDMETKREGLWMSADGLRGLGAAAAPELALLVSALDRPELATRQNALFVLAGLGPAAMPALPLVLQQLDGEDSWCWALVGECVRGIGAPAAPFALPKYEQRFSAGAHLALQLVVGLQVLGAAAEPLLIRGSGSADPMLRWKADEALLQMAELSDVGAARLVELLAKPEPENLQKWFEQPTPWRHLIGPLAQLSTIPPALARRLPELLDHPDAMAFEAIRGACVRALCPTAADYAAGMTLVAPLSREELRRVLRGAGALGNWLDEVAAGEDVARAAMARELRGRLGGDPR